MAGPVHEILAQDHRRLDGLLRRSVARGGEVDRSVYDEFRAGLLRHIAMEEKVLLPLARRLRGGEPLPIASRLRRDHAALAALLVLPPAAEIVDAIRSVLEPHNALEECAGGLYETCEGLVGAEAAAVASKLRAFPEVRVAAYRDGPRVRAHVRRVLEAARRPRDDERS